VELRALILYYTVWVVVAIAAAGIIYHTLAARDLRRDRAVLKERAKIVARLVLAVRQTLRDRSRELTPTEKIDLQKQKSVGVRVSLYLMVPLLWLAWRYGGNEWGLVMALCGLFIIPALTLPISVAHTYLLRFIGFRGPLTSTATGALLGAALARMMMQPDYIKAFTIYGAVYGLLIGLGNTALFAPRIIADDRPRTLEEQAKADRL
jgi:hypothetical protein